MSEEKAAYGKRDYDADLRFFEAINYYRPDEERYVTDSNTSKFARENMPWYIKRCIYLETEIESWHILCEGYLANIKSLESQLAAADGQNGALREALENVLQAIADGESCREYVNGEMANYIGNAVDPESDAVNEAERILSLTPTRAGEQVRRLEAVAEAAKNCRKACRQLDNDIEAGIYSYIGNDTPLDKSDTAIKELDNILAEMGGEPE